MNKPKDADMYGWDKFIKWCERNNVGLEYEEDWINWWECWKAGFVSGINFGS